VELRNSEWKVYLDDMSKLRYQIMRRGWIGDYRDPMTFIELFTSHSDNNNTCWSNADFDRLVKEANAEVDPKRRLALFAQAEKILMDEMPGIPLYFYVSSDCWKETVQGVYQNVQDIHPGRKRRSGGRRRSSSTTRPRSRRSTPGSHAANPSTGSRWRCSRA
jgi:oligopeptide transport system substrate-binding protein